MKRSPAYLTTCLLIAASLSLASGCATTDTLSFPPAADLRPTAKPRLDPVRLEAEIAAGRGEAYLDAFDISLEVWGQMSHDAQLRLCEFHRAKGMRIDCTPLPAPPVE